MKRTRRDGFTLIELLTVIAIIAILSAITFSVLPKIREKGKLTALQGSFSNLQKALTLYASRDKQGSYPPAYGYLTAAARKLSVNEIGSLSQQQVDALSYYQPWGSFIELNKAKDIYDNFASEIDSDHDGSLALLEYTPIGQKNVSTGVFTFHNEIYRENGSPADEVAEQLKARDCPIRYVPVNTKQVKAATRYWLEDAKDPLASTWDMNNDKIKDFRFPPPKYDAYVLISVGPADNTFGVLAEPPSGAPAAYAFQIAAIRTYFLATRDLNQDGVLDLDYDPQNLQRKLEYTISPANSASYQVNNLLPSPTQPAGYGPRIFTSN